MKKTGFLLLFLIANLASQAQVLDLPFSLDNWKLELPTGYKASDWKLSNFQRDRFAKPFFYLDLADTALTMIAYPAEGKSTARYTRCTLREQMQAGSNDVNWTFKDGALLETEFRVVEISEDLKKNKAHRTILFQIDGRTSSDQNEELGLEKSVSMPFLKIYWQDGWLYVKRRILKDEFTVGNALLDKNSWKESKGENLAKIGHDKIKLSIEVKRGAVLIRVNNGKPLVYRDASVKQWYFENYFTAGNYLQSKDTNAYCMVKYYDLKLSHD